MPQHSYAQPAALPAVEFEDDRANINPGELVVLIIEDDPQFAGVLLDVVRQNGFKGLVALNGSAGLTLVQEYMPHAITLDVFLPDMDGWMVLDQIKIDPLTRHIPVTIISGDDVRVPGRKRGAFACIQKPVNKASLEQVLARLNDFARRKERSLLVVEDNPVSSENIVKMIESPDLAISVATTAEEALTLLRKMQFDCMVLDLKLPGMSGLGLLESIQTNPVLREIPVIVYTGKDLTRDEEALLQKYAQGVIIKGVSSPERILDDTSLFLHRAVNEMPEAQRQMLEQFYKSDSVLRGRKILLVDDDVRNLFALTTVLERYDMDVITAENGKAALQILETNGKIDVVLMDIMMPEMDGYETMRNIRKQQDLSTLPIIALTAKAMKGDREKCIEAGASDYITKPVNTSQLTSRLRTLFYRKDKAQGTEA